MALRGERFTVDFSDDEDEAAIAPPAPALNLVGDILEKDVSAIKPPSAPVLKSTSTGFPEHKKRPRISAFKQQRNQTQTTQPTRPESQTNTQTLTSTDGTWEENERQRIDEENNRKLASMSHEEIMAERQELLSTLDPTLIQNLLKRANLDEGRGDTGIEIPSKEKPTSQGEEEEEGEEIENPDATKLPKPTGTRISAAKTITLVDQDAEPTDPGPLYPTSDYKPPQIPIIEGAPKIHFPHPPSSSSSSAPDLDPSDPEFFENLHKKYFPNLPADPTKLAWMAPIPTHGSLADQDSPYYPAQEAIAASALRFDFKGALLPPRIARAMPTDRGLHHHGEAPESAGYTVPELARLARSTFPAQRCMAFQTLGRLLYRLGRGVFGREESEMTKGLWRCVEEGKVIETLEAAAKAEGGHQGSKNYAIEAVWLWQKGGGRRWKAS